MATLGKFSPIFRIVEAAIHLTIVSRPSAMGALQVHNKFGKPTPSPEDIQSGEVVYVDSRTGLYSVNPDGAVQYLFSAWVG
jgi:hypothetical protein